MAAEHPEYISGCFALVEIMATTNKPMVTIPAFGKNKFELLVIVAGTAQLVGKDNKPFCVSVKAIKPTNKIAREMIMIGDVSE